VCGLKGEAEQTDSAAFEDFELGEQLFFVPPPKSAPYFRSSAEKN
jgi:hypothetical protein